AKLAPRKETPRGLDLAHQDAALGGTLRTSGRDTTFGKLIEERLVAHFENAGRFGTIPAHTLKHLDESPALRIPGRCAGDRFQPPEFIGRRGGCQSALTSGGDPVPATGGPDAVNELLSDQARILEYHETADGVLKLSDVPRP